MASTGEVIRSLLTADPAVAALVGDRIYPMVAQQEAPRPFIVYTLVSDQPVNSLQGHTSRWTFGIFQVDCYSQRYAEAHEIANAVHAVLASHTTPELSTHRVQMRDGYEDETQLYRVSMDFSVAQET